MGVEQIQIPSFVTQGGLPVTPMGHPGYIAWHPITLTFTAPGDPVILIFTLTDRLGLSSAPDTVVITLTAPLQAGVLIHR